MVRPGREFRVTVAWGESGPAAPDTGSCITNGSGSCLPDPHRPRQVSRPVTATAERELQRRPSNVTSNGRCPKQQAGEDLGGPSHPASIPPTITIHSGWRYLLISVTQDRGQWSGAGFGRNPSIS